MILYRPTDGDAHTVPVRTRPRTCFLMTQLGEPVPDEALAIRVRVQAAFEAGGFEVVDANSRTTGRDFLLKIWETIASVPVGVVIVHRGMKPMTLANVFYEVGLMQALGKETLVVKAPRARVPSDFVRTEYVTADSRLENRLAAYLDSLRERESYYGFVGGLVENNPLLALDYFRRAYSLFGDRRWVEDASDVLAASDLSARATDSVEMILASFLREAG